MARFESQIKFGWQYCRKIIYPIARAWKEMFVERGDNISDLIINEHHLMKNYHICCLEKLNSRELYTMQRILNVEKPTDQTHFEKNFKNLEKE